MYSEGDATIGFVLREAHTKKVYELCEYMDKHPYQLITMAIDTLHNEYKRKVDPPCQPMTF